MLSSNRVVYEQACTLSLTLALAVGGWSAPIRGPFTTEMDPWTHFTGVWGGEGSKNIWTGLEKNLTLAGIRSEDRPVRSQSTYRPSYPGPQLLVSLDIEIKQQTQLRIHVL